MYCNFFFFQFWMSAIAITLPVPAGVFMPVFTIGEYSISKFPTVDFSNFSAESTHANKLNLTWNPVNRGSIWTIGGGEYGSVVSKWDRWW